MSLAWWKELFESIVLSQGKAECGITIWDTFSIVYQYSGLGIRNIPLVNGSISEYEKAIIEKYFTEQDKRAIYSFVDKCVEKKRIIEVTPIIPLKITISPSEVLVFEMVRINIEGTPGLGEISIYVDNTLLEHYVNQSIPQSGVYIPVRPGSYKVIVRHYTTNETATAIFSVKEKKPREIELPPPPPSPPSPPVAITPTPTITPIEEKPPEILPVKAITPTPTITPITPVTVPQPIPIPLILLLLLFLTE